MAVGHIHVTKTDWDHVLLAVKSQRDFLAYIVGRIIEPTDSVTIPDVEPVGRDKRQQDRALLGSIVQFQRKLIAGFDTLEIKKDKCVVEASAKLQVKITCMASCIGSTIADEDLVVYQRRRHQS